MKSGYLTSYSTLAGLDEGFPVGRSIHSGLWGWERINGCLDLSRCVFGSKLAATRDRNRAWREALDNAPFEIAIAKLDLGEATDEDLEILYGPSRKAK